MSSFLNEKYEHLTSSNSFFWQTLNLNTFQTFWMINSLFSFTRQNEKMRKMTLYFRTQVDQLIILIFLILLFASRTLKDQLIILIFLILSFAPRTLNDQLIIRIFLIHASEWEKWEKWLRTLELKLINSLFSFFSFTRQNKKIDFVL